VFLALDFRPLSDGDIVIAVIDLGKEKRSGESRSSPPRESHSSPVINRVHLAIVGGAGVEIPTAVRNRDSERSGRRYLTFLVAGYLTSSTPERTSSPFKVDPDAFKQRRLGGGWREGAGRGTKRRGLCVR